MKRFDMKFGDLKGEVKGVVGGNCLKKIHSGMFLMTICMRSDQVYHHYRDMYLIQTGGSLGHKIYPLIFYI